MIFQRCLRILIYTRIYHGDRVSLAFLVAQAIEISSEHKVLTLYQDDDEPENFCGSIEDLDNILDCYDIGDTVTIEESKTAVISSRKFDVIKTETGFDYT